MEISRQGTSFGDCGLIILTQIFSDTLRSEAICPENQADEFF